MSNFTLADIQKKLEDGTLVGVEGLDDLPANDPLRQTAVQHQPARVELDEMAVPARYTTGAGKKFKSKTERASLGYLLEKYSPDLLLYEPIILRLPGGNYEPDWLMKIGSEVTFIEVKGERYMKAYGSGRSSRRAQKEAAHWYGWLGHWVLLIKGKGEWREEAIQ